MPIVKTMELLAAAEKGKYAVGAFNINSLDQPQALIARAAKLKAPIIMVVPGIMEPYVPFDEFVAVTAFAANRANIPVAIHLSHGDLAICERALTKGFTSVMYDGSKLSFLENVKTTAQAVAMGHAFKAEVEGELGALGSSFADVSESMTDPLAAKDFVQKTGVDILAVSIGNSHGFYKGTPQVDVNRLISIRKAIKGLNCALTLHGGTGIPEETIRACIGEGISKICIYTEMCNAGKKNAIEYCQNNPEYKGNYDIPELLRAITNGFADAEEEYIRMFQSADKA